MEALEDRVAPAVYDVTTTSDVVDAFDSFLSFREAVLAANASVGVADTINLPAGIYTLTRVGAGEDGAGLGDLDLRDDLTIQGAGVAVTIVDGNASDRVFDVFAGTFVLRNLTIRNGRVAGDPINSTVVGGGVRSVGTLTLEACTVTGNLAVGPDSQALNNPVGGIGQGGGIWQKGGALQLTNCVVSGNRAAGGAGLGTVNTSTGGAASGGGLYADNSLITITGGSIRQNVAQAGDGSVNQSIARGGAAAGGGLFVGSPTGGAASRLDVTACAIADNQAVGGRGTAANSSGASGSGAGGSAVGGGVSASGNTVRIAASTVTGNAAVGGVGTGILFGYGQGGAATAGGVYLSATAAANGPLDPVNLSAVVISGNRAMGGEGVSPSSTATGGAATAGGLKIVAAGGIVSGDTVSANQAVGGAANSAASNSSTGQGGAAAGGGTLVDGAIVWLNCTLSGNRAQGGAAGASSGRGGDALGGGLSGWGAVISNCTMTLNVAAGGGGNQAVGASRGGGLGSDGTKSTPTSVRSSIIAGNSTATLGRDVYRPAGYSFVSLGANVIGDGTGAVGFVSGSKGDQVGSGLNPIDPRLGPLADNGGPTPTHLPFADSPALDRGAADASVTTDQRGAPRRSGPGVDVGSVEFPSVIPGGSATFADVTSAGGATYDITVTYAGAAAIDPSTISTGDIRVTGPNGFGVAPALVSVVGAGGAQTATYRLTPPGGTWDAVDGGAYLVTIEPGQVADLQGRVVPATNLGAFHAIPGNIYTVTNADDSGPGTLREAIDFVNAASPAITTVTFDAALFVAPRTIALNGQLTIRDAVSIIGPGPAQLAIDGSGVDRLFDVQGGGHAISVTFSGLTLRNGHPGNAHPGSGIGARAGGAINAALAGVTLTNCVLTGNDTTTSGGAIYVAGPGGLTLLNCTLSNNFANSDGGAVLVGTGGTLTVRGCVVSANTAENGGGINSSGATAQIENSTIVGNTAYTGGGGIYIFGGTLAIFAATISANKARSGWGGGVFITRNFTAQIVNSTVSGNQGGNGGGITLSQNFPTQGTLSLQNCTVTQNVGNAGPGLYTSSASQIFTVNITSSILSGNVRADLSPVADISSEYPITLISSALGNATGLRLTSASGNNLPSGTPLMLGPLADNGGPTKTHALLAGSPCIDAGSNPAGVTTDQRGFGFPRTAGPATDIGAYEFIPAGTPSASAGPLPDVGQPGGAAYDFTVTFRDDTAISVASLGNGDVRVTGPNGFSSLPTFLGVDLNTNGTLRSATYRLIPPGGSWDATDNGAYTVSLEPNQVADTAGNFALASALGQFYVATPVTFQAIQVNDGSMQRSRVTGLTMTFSGTLQFAASAVNAFDLRRSDGTVIALSATVAAVAGRTIVTLNFTGTGVESGSLADGNYTLTIFGASARSGPTGPLLDADGDGVPGGDRTFQFHRLFGDVNGDKAVNGLDLAAFRAAFGTVARDPDYVSYLDQNGDGAINGTDLTASRNRFGVVLP